MTLRQALWDAQLSIYTPESHLWVYVKLWSVWSRAFWKQQARWLTRLLHSRTLWRYVASPLSLQKALRPYKEDWHDSWGHTKLQSLWGHIEWLIYVWSQTKGWDLVGGMKLLVNFVYWEEDIKLQRSSWGYWQMDDLLPHLDGWPCQGCT